MSKLIREGVITREQALIDLKMQFSDELLNDVLNRIDCSVEDLRKD
jgi:hypothetical protein